MRKQNHHKAGINAKQEKHEVYSISSTLRKQVILI